MTRYEILMSKAELCTVAASKTSGYMQKVWIKHANELREQAANLPLVKAHKYIEELKLQRGY